MSNHYHLVITETEGALPDFMASLNHSVTSPATRTRRPPPSTCTTQKPPHAVRSLVEPEFWTPKWTPLPAKRPKTVHWYDLSFRNHWVGHPGLEPGANGLRTQRRTAHKALLLSDSDTRTRPIPVTKGHVSTYSGHRDRLDRAGLVAKIHAALDAKAVTPDDAANLIALIEGTLASRHKN
jgi:hypothetical protein